MLNFPIFSHFNYLLQILIHFSLQMIKRSFIQNNFNLQLFCCSHQIHTFPSWASCSSLVNQNSRTFPLEFLNATSGKSMIFQMRGLRQKVRSARKEDDKAEEEESTQSSSASAADLEKELRKGREKLIQLAIQGRIRRQQRMAEQPTILKKIGVFFEEFSASRHEAVPHIMRLSEIERQLKEAINSENTSTFANQQNDGPKLPPEHALLMEFHNKFSEFMKEYMRKKGKHVRFGIARTDSLRPAIQEFVNKFNEEHAKKTGLEIEVTHMDMINLKMMGLYCVMLAINVYFMMKMRPMRETFEQKANYDQLPESTPPQFVQPTGMSTELYTFCCLLSLFLTIANCFLFFLIKKRGTFRVVPRKGKKPKE